jgi:hypothetical protein
MLTKRRCTATGAINFFARHEPYIAVGTIIAREAPEHYVWHFHGEAGPAAGLSRDCQSAEKAITDHYLRARATEEKGRCAA